MSDGTTTWTSVGTIYDSEGTITKPMPAAQTKLCWRARATDHAGNVGSWKTACTRLGRIERLAGTEPHLTAVAVSRRAFPDGVPSLYVATSANAREATAAAAAAGYKGRPVLLVGKDSVSTTVATEIERLAPSRIYLIGRTSVVSSSVARKLAELAPVTRIGGANMYETSALVSKATYGSLADDPGVSVQVANAGNGVHLLAVAASEINYGEPNPLLLTKRDYVPGAVLTEVRRLDPPGGCVVGGLQDVSDHAFLQLHEIISQGYNGVCRWSGGDYKVAAYLAAYTNRGPKEEIYVASGSSIPDAIAATTAARKAHVPLVLVTKWSIPEASKRLLEEAEVGTIRIVGDTDAISWSVAEDLKRYLD
ncbi:hypothetical protein GCM10009751_19330 [Myceligenerans crystallogenes]|uniref:Cell wall binding repeat 2 n=1 Tax=Myceligenerans crystallogenes TaxID=316335 RepID=A0ABN2NCP4_9MICO